MARICVIGAGSVGLVSAVGFASFGHEVSCIEKNADRLDCVLRGALPFYEPQLAELLQSQLAKGRLNFYNSVADCSLDNALVFICVESPPTADGRIDISYVRQAVSEVVRSDSKPSAIVLRSTVPTGTAALLEQEHKLLSTAGPSIEIGSNPEFLREGSAVLDFTNPNRVVIGAATNELAERMKGIYTDGFVQKIPFVLTSREAAEMIKLTANAFIATQLSFVNELDDLCGKSGVNLTEVLKGIGLDHRIGLGSFKPGPGWGGPCLEKDSQALVNCGEQLESRMCILEAALKANQDRMLAIGARVVSELRAVLSPRIAVLGLTFKENTSDLRHSPAITITNHLLSAGIRVVGYDPKVKASDNSLPNHLEIVNSAYEATQAADCLLILTDWEEFRTLDYDRIVNGMNGRMLIDPRNILTQEKSKRLRFRHIWP